MSKRNPSKNQYWAIALPAKGGKKGSILVDTITKSKTDTVWDFESAYVGKKIADWENAQEKGYRPVKIKITEIKAWS